MSKTRDAKELLEESIKVQLRLAMASGDPSGAEAMELARMHERWIRIHWGDGYSALAHRGLAQGYLADERFRKYYDSAAGPGTTEFLVRALENFLHNRGLMRGNKAFATESCGKIQRDSN